MGCHWLLMLLLRAVQHRAKNKSRKYSIFLLSVEFYALSIDANKKFWVSLIIFLKIDKHSSEIAGIPVITNKGVLCNKLIIIIDVKFSQQKHRVCFLFFIFVSRTMATMNNPRKTHDLPPTNANMMVPTSTTVVRNGASVPHAPHVLVPAATTSALLRTPPTAPPTGYSAQYMPFPNPI